MSNKKILIVEDDVDVRLGYGVLLRAHGYDTFFAVDGMSAISEARKHQPDLIILDLGLPACYGFMVLEGFSANTCLARIPVVCGVRPRPVRSSRKQATRFECGRQGLSAEAVG
jgi:CheY-like chemotaxis protein